MRICPLTETLYATGGGGRRINPRSRRTADKRRRVGDSPARASPTGWTVDSFTGANAPWALAEITLDASI